MPDECSEIEVTAVVVGSYNEQAALAGLSPLGLFAWGTDRNGSRIYRLMVEAEDERAACTAVLDALLHVEGIAPHDIRAGPLREPAYEGEDDLQARLEGFLTGLSPEARDAVTTRLSAWAAAQHPR